jgi:ABC-type glutathione transport system ATPase component
VQQALDRAMQARNRAVMVIAHRLSTVRNADATLVMDRGRIVERGTHQQLLALRGIYWSLVQRQQQGLAPEDRDLAPEEPEAPAPHSSNGGGGGGVMPSEDGLQTTVMSMMGSVEEEDASGVGVANDIVPLPMSSDSIKGAAGGRANAPAQVGLVGVDSKI